MLSLKVKIFGKVQGVGLRGSFQRLASTYEMIGYIKNNEDGSVEFLLQNNFKNLDILLLELQKVNPRIKITKTTQEFLDYPKLSSFEIL